MTDLEIEARTYTPDCKCSELGPTWPVARPHAHIMSCPWFHIELQARLLATLQTEIEELKRRLPAAAYEAVSE